MLRSKHYTHILSLLNNILEVLLMADTPFAASPQTERNHNHHDDGCSDAVCIDANRVYDSCGEED